MSSICTAVSDEEEAQEVVTFKKEIDYGHVQPEDDSPSVLPEDHPLLERFQQTLKAHLIRVRDQLISEIQDLDYNIKQKEQEREDIGCKLYDFQQEIRQQNSILQEYETQVKEATEKRLKHEKNVEISKKEYGEKLMMYKDEKRFHNQRILELSSLQVLENNIEKWASEVETEVQMAKRAVSKDWQEQKAISEEKKKMDLILFTLDDEVRKREQELNGVNEQIKDQRCVLETLNKDMSDATTDLEVLQQEHKRLTQGWSEVIIAIQQRDKLLYQMKDDLEKEYKNQKLLQASIDATKKECTKAMEENERLVSFKARVEEDIATVEKQIQKEEKDIAKHDSKLEKINALISQAENDLSASKAEGNALEVQLRSVQSHLDKLNQKKTSIEEKILSLAQDQITSDKASSHRMKMLRDVQSQRRSMEVNLTQVENNLSNSLLELERMRGVVGKLKEESQKIEEERQRVQADADKLAEEIKAIDFSTNVKISLVDQLTKKWMNLLQLQGGGDDCPYEVQLKGLEKNLLQTEHQIKEQQNFWLLLQGHVVHLSEKRYAQMNDIQLARKQLLVIEQKTLKVDTELAEASTLAKETWKHIQNMNTKLDLLGAKLYRKKQIHERDSMESHHIRLDLLDRFRDSEMSVLALEQEVVDLTKEVEQYKEVVLEMHREALSWETKYKMAEEMNRIRNEEKTNDGEIGSMRAEIHRMEVRYNQLRRAQEKLIQDLDHCVLHREQIFVQAMQRERTETGAARSRPNVQHKLNEMKNKIKQAQSEISSNEAKLKELNGEFENVSNEIARYQEEIEGEKLQDSLTQAEIEQGMLGKHQNLENIVRKQHRAKRYRALVAMKNLPKCRSESSTESNMAKQKEINDNLADIIHILLNDFQDKKYYLMRILQTLREE